MLAALHDLAPLLVVPRAVLLCIIVLLEDRPYPAAVGEKLNNGARGLRALVILSKRHI